MKVHFDHSGSPKASGIFSKFLKSRQNCPIDECDIIVPIGGDGFMLETLHKISDLGIDRPVYGINGGSVGFLMNDESNNSSIEKLIEESIPHEVFPLRIIMEKVDGSKIETYAFNDFYVNRTSRQAAKLSITINGIKQIDSFIGDGLIISTEIGSTAYNRSAGGPIVPIGSNITLVTPICGCYPIGWNGFIITSETPVTIENIEIEKRPIVATADVKEYENIKSATIVRCDKPKVIRMDSFATFNNKLIRIQKGTL